MRDDITMNAEKPEHMPNGLLIWNNASRTSLPLGLMIWLGFLVLTCLASGFFVARHMSPRWVLGGFIASHVLVVLLFMTKRITMRRGLVSLTHLLCWTPGLVLTIADRQGRAGDVVYEIWSYALMLVISVSFIFDLRDAATYLYCALRGKLPEADDGDGASGSKRCIR
ncbi:MAG: hypothetical protein WBF93_10630 [Pirellulales bacterium]